MTAEPVSRGRFGWGILATGGIAGTFTRDLLDHGHRVVAVGSRARASADAFSRSFGIPHAHGSYEELVSDPDVDIVYVATPHTQHADNALLALRHGKHVLIEKPFTVNAGQAREVAEVARSEGLLVMEAMWTRFLPHMADVRAVARGGRLGTIRSLHADHTQRLPDDPAHRLNDPDRAGGSLLDLGVYPVSFAWNILGRPTDVEARAGFTATGVDESVATLFRHEGGAMSTSYTSMRTRGPNVATILGTEGRLELSSVWYAPTTVTWFDAEGTVVDVFEQEVSGRGMQYQAAEVERLLSEGRRDSEVMPVGESVAIMATLDEIRERIGLRYPFET